MDNLRCEQSFLSRHEDNPIERCRCGHVKKFEIEELLLGDRTKDIYFLSELKT